MQAELLTAILDKFSLSAAAELYFHDETCQLILRKENAPVRTEGTPPFFPEPSVPQPRTSPRTPAKPPENRKPEGKKAEKETEPGEKTGTGELITSPIVATFYASAGPDSPPFVSVGGKVKKGDILCILEAMKMMNHLEAEFDCEILAVLGKSGEMAEFGQPLFEVNRL